MQQINLELDDDPAPAPTLNQEQIQALITAMADAIIAVLPDRHGANHERD